MPDFGLKEALEAALEAASKTKVMRPAEQKLAASAAQAAPKGAAPVVPTTQPAAPPVASTTPAPGATQAPRVNPSMPPPEVPSEAAALPQDAAGAAPAPAPVAAAAGGAAPPTPSVGLPEPPVAPGPRPTPAPGSVAPANVVPVAQPEAIPPSLNATIERANTFVRQNITDFPPEKLDMTHMPNTDVMTSPDQVKAAILKIADDNQATIEAARGGTVSDAQVRALADEMAVNQDTLTQALHNEFGSVSPGRREAIALAARTVQMNNAGRMFELAGKVADGTASSEEIIAFSHQEQVMLQWQSQIANAAAGSGRLQRAFGQPVGLEPAVMDHIADLLKRTDITMQEKAQAIRYAGTPAGIANIVSGMNGIGAVRGSVEYVKGLIRRIFVNGILSGPGTWAKILVGNNVNLALNSFDMYAAGLGRTTVGLAARLGGYPLAEEGVQMSDTYAHVHGVISGGADALRVAGRVMRTGVSLDNVMRAREVTGGADNLAQVFPQIQDTLFGGIARVIDGVIDAPGSRIIGGIDEFTKTLGYRGYVTMQTMKEIRARLATGSLKPGDAEAVARDMMQNPSPEIQQAAEEWAHRQTFQSPLGEAGKSFQNVINKVPALRFIFPFMRTATNIFKQSIGERTLLGMFSERIRNQVLQGGFEGDLAKARMATGTAIGGMLGWMAIHDRITGGAPRDARERAVWDAEGRKPYSFRVGDSWYSYQWHEPIASVAGTIADAISLASYIHANDDVDSLRSPDAKVWDAVSHVMASVIENTGNKTFMQGAAQFSELYNDPGRYLQTYANQIAGSFVPFSGAFKFIRNEQDPYMRHAQTLLDHVRNELPTIFGISGSETLPARADMFGEPRKTASGNSVLGPLSPFQSSQDKRDNVSDEIQDLMERTRRVPISMPSQRLAMGGSGAGIQDGMGMRLNADEYEEYVRLARASAIFPGGRTFRQELERVMSTPTYLSASPVIRAGYLEQVQHTADHLGAKALYDNNGDFRDRMNAWTTEKNRIKLSQ